MDSGWRNNELFPVCWSRLASKKKTWRCNEEVLLIVGNNYVFVKRVWVDGRVCRGSLMSGFVRPAPRTKRQPSLCFVHPGRCDTAAVSSSVAAALSAVVVGLLDHFPLPLKACGEGKEAVYFRTAIIQDGANVCRGLQGGRFRWPADLARSDWHS